MALVSIIFVSGSISSENISKVMNNYFSKRTFPPVKAQLLKNMEKIITKNYFYN